MDAGTRPAVELPGELDGYHPGLRELLERELAAGNAIREIGRDFPRPGSVLVRLNRRLQPRPERLPAGVEYTALNDPHWWMDEYVAGDPQHLLVS